MQKEQETGSKDTEYRREGVRKVPEPIYMVLGTEVTWELGYKGQNKSCYITYQKAQ